MSDSSTAPTPSDEPPGGGVLSNGGTYDVVITDTNVGPARLEQHWVVVENLDVTTPAYRDAVKQIVAELARDAGTTDLIVSVMTNRQIAEAESPATVHDFILEHGDEYLVTAIPRLEVEGWVASYAGGLNPDMEDEADPLSGYEILWWPSGDLEVEAWKPALQ